MKNVIIIFTNEHKYKELKFKILVKIIIRYYANLFNIKIIEMKTREKILSNLTKKISKNKILQFIVFIKRIKIKTFINKAILKKSLNLNNFLYEFYKIFTKKMNKDKNSKIIN